MPNDQTEGVPGGGSSQVPKQEQGRSSARDVRIGIGLYVLWMILGGVFNIAIMNVIWRPAPRELASAFGRVVSFAVSFLIGQRMMTGAHRSPASFMVSPSDLPKPRKVEVYVPETPPAETPAPTPHSRWKRRGGSMHSGKKSGVGYTVQAGAFKVRQNAWNLRNKLRHQGHRASVVKRGALYRVEIGYYSGLATAQKAAANLTSKGIAAVVVKR